MNIQDYLLKKHLKPLFIFRFDKENSSECFGVFVSCKEKSENGDSDFVGLKLIGSDSKPKWKNETPLWIIPLIRNNKGSYDINFDSTVDLTRVIKINACFINIVNQKNTTSWANYLDLNPIEELPISHYLNFEAKEFSLLKDKYDVLEISSPTENKKIQVYLFGKRSIKKDEKVKDGIKITDRLIKFSGIECDIVDNNGIKHDFNIWCGIRDKEDDKEYQNKIVLTINAEDDGVSDQAIGTDCPIVWRKKGLLEDTIFPDKKTSVFSLSNNKLALKTNNTKDEDISKNLSIIDYNKYIDTNNYYSWFIKEGLEDGNGIYLFPFFKRISENKITSQLDKFILRDKDYNLIYFFQVNRYQSSKNSKSIILWLVAGISVDYLNNEIERYAISRTFVNKAGQESISPKIGNLEFNNLNQIILEYTITKNGVSFDNLKIFDNPNKFVERIEKLSDSLNKNSKIIICNYRLNQSNRVKPIFVDNKEKIIKSNLEFNTTGISKENDTGTFFAFSISDDKDSESKLSGVINDGSFSFELDKDGTIEGKVYFSLQLQKAQKPLYLWEWYRGLEEQDTIISCYAIEDFRLPVSKVTPLSTDLSEQDRYIANDDNTSLASTGTLRPTPHLIIPLENTNNDNNKTTYYLSLSENINVGQDFNFSAELILREPEATENTEKNNFDVVVLGHQPQTTIRVQTPFGTNPQYDDGKWVVARKNNLSADGGIWEILNEQANEEGIQVTFPPQVLGEAFRKTDKNIELADLIGNEPIDNKLVEFKFSPPTQLQIANEQLSRQMVTTPWNLRHLFGSYGDSNPGLRLLKAQFELLYGMSANLENKNAYIAELENKLGQLVKAPRGQIVWEHSDEQKIAFSKAFTKFAEMLQLYNSRVAIYEVSAEDKFKPAKFTEGIDYFFRVDYDKGIDKRNKGAKLYWPFKGNKVPEYLNKIKERYHDDKGLSGGFHFGFESMAVYKEVFEEGIKYGSTSGEIENLSFTSIGGSGKQVARFANDKSIIKSTTSLGRTHFYAVERIGRIGVFWNKAKHVIEYERTVVPSEQFKNTQNVGRVIVRKVREFVEILEPERRYPEFGATPSESGSILGTHFKSIKIPVSSCWGTDIVRGDNTIGWEVPLWNEYADHKVYPFPQIMLNVLAPKDAGVEEVLCNIANPENLYFYTDVRPEIDGKKITSHTNEWPSVVNVDYTLQEFENIYLGVKPCLDYNDPNLINTPLPSPLDVLPGFERYTFRIIPSDVLISANGAYNSESAVAGKLRTVMMQRKIAIKLEEAKAYPYTKNIKNFLQVNLNGYSDIIKQKEKDVQTVVVNHLKSIAKIDENESLEFLKDIAKVTEDPQYKYMSTAVSDVAEKWEIPTKIAWYQLTKEIDAGIGAVDKHYNYLFKEAKEELDQIFQLNPTGNLKEIVLERIIDFKNRITDLKTQIDINLNQFDDFIKKQKKQIDSTEQEVALVAKIISNIKNAIINFISVAIKKVDEIEATTLAGFVKKIKDDIITEVDDIVEKIYTSANVNDRIKVVTIDKIKEFITNNVYNKIDEYLQKLENNPTSYNLKDAKKKIKELLNNVPIGSIDLTSLNEDILEKIKLINGEIDTASNSLVDVIRDFKNILDDVYKIIIKNISTFKDEIEEIGDVSKIKEKINEFFEPDKDDKEKFKQVTTFLKDKLVPPIQKFLIEGYKNDEQLPVPPLANLFEKADKWIKGQINSFKSILNNIIKKYGDNPTVKEIEEFINNNFAALKTIYTELDELEKAIISGDKDAIIKNANELSQAINKDFGKVMGEATKKYYQAIDVTNYYDDLDKELKTTLTNYRSVFEEIKAVDLGFNRKTIELVRNIKNNQAPRLLLTPVMGKLQKLNDGLNSMGISIPYAGLEDKFIAPLKEWGNDFKESFSNNFPISNLLNDIGGIKFDHLFPFLKSDDAFFRAVKITHDLDKASLKAWVQADVDYTFTDDNTFMNIGPVKVRMLRNARVTARAYESIDIDKNRQSENKGALKATFEISLSGTPLMYFRDTVVSFKNGKYDFDLDPKRMEMPGLLKLLTDATQNIQTLTPAVGKKASPFKVEILKTNYNGYELPIGAKANLDIPPLSIGGGPTSISNLSFGGNFIMQAIDPNEKPLKLDFLVGLGFYLGKRDKPFNFSAFILGGGGYIDCNFRYKPSESGLVKVNFIMSVHASAALAINAGWINGSIMVLAGIEVEYRSGTGGSTRIEIFIAIIGSVDILGLISIYLELRLAINYLSSGSGTVLYGTGTVSVKIKICAFVTIRVHKSYTMVLKGESRSVSNQRSESIAASLN